MNEKKQIIAITSDPYDNIYGYSIVFMKLFCSIAKNENVYIKIISTKGRSSGLILRSFPEYIKFYEIINIKRRGIVLNGILFLFKSFIFLFKNRKSYKNCKLVANSELPELFLVIIAKHILGYKNIYCFVHDIFPPEFRKFGNLYLVIRKLFFRNIKNIIVLKNLHKSIIEKEVKNVKCNVIPNPIFIYK